VSRCVLFLLLFAIPARMPAQQPAAGAAPKIQVLVITGQNGHDWRSTTPVLRKILEDTGRFEVRVTEEFRGAGPETLTPYDLVVLNYFERRRPELRWGERAESALLHFVRSGKGLVLYHFSAAAFDGWEEYEKMSGGNWRPNNGHHSARHDFKVDIKDPDYPITRGLKPSFPEFNDELYANLRWQPANTYHVLATAWDDHSLYKGKARELQPIPGPGLDQPMLWTVHYGNGRVFATALGHDAEAMKNIGFITTFQRGAEWAATGSVTLPVPPELAR
jgi:type 1 glutamine amidotransferase